MTQTAGSNSTVNKTVLENGLTVISEKIPAYRSIAVGVWVKSGSRSESEREKGIAHFIEHMVFRGTKKRSALTIARSLEELGGNLNAFTAKEETCFYVHTLDSHLRISINVLADMVCNPLFREKDILKEKQVVLEEINAVKDTPEEYVFDLFQEQLFPRQGLGYPILGEAETIRQFDQETLRAYWQKYFQPQNLIVAAAGNVTHETLVKMVSRHFSFPATDKEAAMPEAARAAKNVHFNLPQALNQTHICMGTEVASYRDPRRFDLVAINTYLGGGMSSRLFQAIREKQGLAYTVYSFLDFYRDTGVLGFYLGTDTRNEAKARSRLVDELKRLLDKRLSEKTVAKIKEQIKGATILSLESSLRRMTRLAKNEINFGRFISLDEMMQSMDAINPDSMFSAARDFVKTDDLSSVILSPAG